MQTYALHKLKLIVGKERSKQGPLEINLTNLLVDNVQIQIPDTFCSVCSVALDSMQQFVMVFDGKVSS